MPCTDDSPCEHPILRWVHSDRCKKLTAKAGAEAKAREELHKEVVELKADNAKLLELCQKLLEYSVGVPEDKDGSLLRLLKNAVTQSHPGSKLLDEISELRNQVKKETPAHKSMSLAEQKWFSLYLESLRSSGQDGSRFATLLDQVVTSAVQNSNMLEKMAEEVDDFTNHSLACEKKRREAEAHAVEIEYKFWLSSIIGAMVISMVRENITWAFDKERLFTKRSESSDQHKIDTLCKRIQELEQQLKDRRSQDHEPNINDIMGPASQD